MSKEVEQRLAERGITFELTDGARQWLAKEGFDPMVGARPLRRAVQRNVETPLSRGILAGEFHEGAHIMVDVGPSGLTFSKAAAATVA